MTSVTNQGNRWVIDRPPQIFCLRLVIDYSLIFGNNRWLISWLLIDYPSIFIDVIEHRWVMPGLNESLSTGKLNKILVALICLKVIFPVDNAILSFNNWGQTFIVLFHEWWCYGRYLWSPVMGGGVRKQGYTTGYQVLEGGYYNGRP